MHNFLLLEKHNGLVTEIKHNCLITAAKTLNIFLLSFISL